MLRWWYRRKFFINEKDILDTFEELGVKLNLEKNNTREEALISADDSKVKVYVVPTNEELMIARDTLELAK